tara:strand:- start:76 stop:642 length:567 start_codon:yes stop_codon:yes gene_type:complete
MDKEKKKKGGVYIEGRWVLKSFVENITKAGYTIKSLLNDYIYIGGSGYYSNDHTNPENESGFVSTAQYRTYVREWEDYISLQEIHAIRPETCSCVCGHKIHENCWLMKEIKKGEVDIAPVIGNCCIKNFLPELKIRRCDICNAEHKRWKYTICDDCEKKKKTRERNKKILAKAEKRRARYKRKYGLGW